MVLEDCLVVPGPCEGALRELSVEPTQCVYVGVPSDLDDMRYAFLARDGANRYLTTSLPGMPLENRILTLHWQDGSAFLAQIRCLGLSAEIELVREALDSLAQRGLLSEEAFAGRCRYTYFSESPVYADHITHVLSRIFPVEADIAPSNLQPMHGPQESDMTTVQLKSGLLVVLDKTNGEIQKIKYA